MVLITGGSAGLGLHLAKAWSQREAHVVLVARAQARLERAAEQLPGEVLTISADLTDAEQVSSILPAVKERFGQLDVLVNCAGRSVRGEIQQTTAEEFAELFELNFLTAVRCTRACLPELLQRRGHVVNIGSLAAKSASRFIGAYPASKFPLAAYSQQLRLELSSQGLHVLLVCPGPIRRDDAGTRYQQTADKVPTAAMQPGGGVRLKGIDPEWLAERVIRGCERRELELVVPSKARLLFAIAQLNAAWGDWLLKKMTRA